MPSLLGVRQAVLWRSCRLYDRRLFSTFSARRTTAPSSPSSDAGPPKQDHLHATTSYHQRHVLFTSNQPPTAWPSHVEKFTTLGTQMTEMCKTITTTMGIPTNFTFTYTGEKAEPNPGSEETADVVVFPDRIKFHGVSSKTLPDLQRHLSELRSSVSLVENSSLKVTRLPQRAHLLVCTHGSRDCRCSARGIPMVKALRMETKKRKLTEKIAVWEVSHIGGHKFAANVIVHPPGDWYGTLQWQDAKAVVDIAEEIAILGKDSDDISQGVTVWWEKWRGRMGLTMEEQESAFLAYGKGNRLGVPLGDQDVMEAWSEPPSSIPTPVVISPQTGLEIPSSTGAAAELEPTTPSAPALQTDCDKPTVTINFSYPNGRVSHARAFLGERVLDAALRVDAPLEAACGGQMECCTCHVILSEPCSSSLPAISEDEDDTLDLLGPERSKTSRLSCQLRVSPEWDGVTVHIPINPV